MTGRWFSMGGAARNVTMNAGGNRTHRHHRVSSATPNSRSNHSSSASRMRPLHTEHRTRGTGRGAATTMTAHATATRVAPLTHTTLVILQDHYEAVMIGEIKELHKLNSPDWSGPFQVASAWAKKYFGRRLSPETLTEARVTIEDWMTGLQIDDPHPVAPAVTAAPVTQTSSGVHPLRRVRPDSTADLPETPFLHTAVAQTHPQSGQPEAAAAAASPPAAPATHVVTAQIMPRPQDAELIATPPSSRAASQRYTSVTSTPPTPGCSFSG